MEKPSYIKRMSYEYSTSEHLPMSSCGSRPLAWQDVVTNAAAKGCAKTSVSANKWQVFRDICAARRLLGLSERSLSVLDALLTFYPETVLAGSGQIVFPSNRELCLRAHGMAETTLRRHLAALVSNGLIIRRDSPNGKRYARKTGSGEIKTAFGFDLCPLSARAQEFAGLAKEVHAEDRALRLARERITLCRRDICKMIELGSERHHETDWPDYRASYRSIIQRLPRGGRLEELEPVAGELTRLAAELESQLELLAFSSQNGANASESERHIQNSKTEPHVESEHRPSNKDAIRAEASSGIASLKCDLPLRMVLEATPDLADFSRGGIANWRDYLAAAAVIRPMIGVSRSAWNDAVEVMGELNASIVMACILQSGSRIISAGGYLRSLTEKSRVGQFSIGPMVMALLSAKRRKFQVGRLGAAT